MVANALQGEHLSAFNTVNWPASYARKAALILRPSRLEQWPKDCGGPCSLGSLSKLADREVLKVVGRVRSDYLTKMKTRLDKVLETPLLDVVKALADDNDLTAEQNTAEQRKAASVWRYRAKKVSLDSRDFFHTSETMYKALSPSQRNKILSDNLVEFGWLKKKDKGGQVAASVRASLVTTMSQGFSAYLGIQ
ncbi:hypothetical protein K470DRAFT_272811 [Piedraia hortae CBS 480.64]|uniref:Uncharacterized protein n=1 Tax=Piedraia hortae CBS 480.64 TaxID=1314780 RepID=A0A6A7BSH3_9PEZI|nr:hypothetical protein K470DRAFT_272811 [Piedraia hortae CBS 480.64]